MREVMSLEKRSKLLKVTKSYYASIHLSMLYLTRLAVMKMKSDPVNEDERTVKRAASAWIENTVQGTKSKKAAAEEQVTCYSRCDPK